MKKIVLCLLLPCLLLAACSKEESLDDAAVLPLPSENTQITMAPEEIDGELAVFSACLGLSDEELVAQRGEGIPAYQQESPGTALASRSYGTEIFGVFGEAAFFLGTAGEINGVLLTLPDIGGAELLERVNQVLAAPCLLLEEGGDYHAEWTNGGDLFRLDEIDGGVTLSISRTLRV